jgi:hypothetical protein
MKYSYAHGESPLELGDTVRIGGESALITDISMTQYVRSGKVEFRYELNGDGKYVRLAIMAPTGEPLPEIAREWRFPLNGKEFRIIHQPEGLYDAAVVNSAYIGGQTHLGSFTSFAEAQDCVAHYAQCL